MTEGEEEEEINAVIMFSPCLDRPTWLGDAAAIATTCAFPWSAEIKAAARSKLHLIIAPEEAGRGSPIQPRYIQVAMTTAQSETTAWSCECPGKKKKKGGGLETPPESKGESTRLLFQQEKRRKPRHFNSL